MWNILNYFKLFIIILLCTLSIGKLYGAEDSIWDTEIEIPSEIQERLSLLEKTLENYSVTFRKNIPLWSPFIIDVSQLQEISSESFSDINISFLWQVENNIISDSNLNMVFEEAGEKEMILQVFWEIDWFEAVVYELFVEVFVFSHTMAFIIEENQRNSFESFRAQARSRGIFIQDFWFFHEGQLSDVNFWELFREYRSRFPVTASDYVTVMGTKEFAITFLRHWNVWDSIENIVIINSFNRTLFREYFRNSFQDETITWNSFLINDMYIEELLRYPTSYESLSQSLIQNWYNILDLNFDMRSHPLFFISSQIQYLWKYFTQSELYILLLIPFFITAVSIFKHLIWLNTLGIIIPVFLTYLMIDIGLWKILILFVLLWTFNIFVSLYLNKFALLYTPKISFLMVLNVITYFFIWHIFIYTGLWEIPFYSLISFIFFIVIAERFLVTVTSKEVLEYKSAISGTLILSIWLTLFAQIDTVRIILFSYPEILLLLLPVNFYLAQFTGLRFTEYLRFKDIMKDVEE